MRCIIFMQLWKTNVKLREVKIYIEKKDITSSYVINAI